MDTIQTLIFYVLNVHNTQKLCFLRIESLVFHGRHDLLDSTLFDADTCDVSMLRGSPKIHVCYPLVNVYIAMENHHF